MTYWRATRHPVPCFLFVCPLLFTYEFGVLYLGGSKSLAMRNGADAWMRWLFDASGIGFGLFAPILVFGALAIWAAKNRHNAPANTPEVLLGMVLESIGFAIVLWSLSRTFGPLLDSFGVYLAAPGDEAIPDQSGVARAVTYLGAGIYEEVVFRSVLFCGGTLILRMLLLPGALAQMVAAGISAAAFAAVHHVGAQGEALSGYVFAFRLIAGLLFAGIFSLRGFGIAVGAHTIYDVLVGIAF